MFQMRHQVWSLHKLFQIIDIISKLCNCSELQNQTNVNCSSANVIYLTTCTKCIFAVCSSMDSEPWPCQDVRSCSSFQLHPECIVWFQIHLHWKYLQQPGKEFLSLPGCCNTNTIYWRGMLDSVIRNFTTLWLK